MQGKQSIIDALNLLLANELTAMDQYFIHSRMYLDWGLQKLYERIDNALFALHVAAPYPILLCK